MSVYVDPQLNYGWKLGPSCHMWADTLAELHEMAGRIGLKRSWFQDKPTLQHYDLTVGKRKAAIAAGVIELDRNTAVEQWRILRQVRKDAMAKKDWKEQAARRLMVLSATQLETYELCKRKWWFKSVRKLPDGDSIATVFGTVLHAVIERYLSGDSQGRGKDGNPVELYPPGWTKAMNRYEKDKVDGEISGADQEIIKMLVGKAIEEGVLECLDDREIEYKFTLDLLQLECPECKGHVCNFCNGEETRKGGTCACAVCDVCGVRFGEEHILAKHEAEANRLAQEGDDPNLCAAILDPAPWVCSTCGGDGRGVHIQITGFNDYMTEDGIQDHKSVKRMDYAKSKNALKENIQMLIGGMVLLDLYAQASAKSVAAGGPPVEPPARISLRHNVYCKDVDDLRVRKTEVFVSPEDIKNNWLKTQAMAREMAEMRRRSKSWHDTPDPASFAKACNAYGGCRFRTICTGQETEESFEKRLDPNLRNGTINTSQEPTTILEEKPIMSIASRIAQRGNASAAAAAGTAMPPGGGVNPPASPPVIQPAAAAAPVVVQQPAPVQTAAPVQAAVAAAVAATVAGAVPWANPGCVSCSGLGLNSAGAPCRICDLKAPSLGKKPSKEYAFDVLGDGTMYWKDRQTGADGVSPMHMPGGTPSEVKGESKVEIPAQEAAAPVADPGVNTLGGVQAAAPVSAPETPGTAPVTGTVAPAAAVAETPATPEKKKRGRQPGSTNKAKVAADGFVLVLGGVVSRGEGDPGSGAGVHRIGDVFNRVTSALIQEHIAQGQNKDGDTFYDLDPFRRRDMLIESGKDIAAEFGNDYIVVDRTQLDPDMRALVDGIRPHAAIEINAVTF